MRGQFTPKSRGLFGRNIQYGILITLNDAQQKSGFSFKICAVNSQYPFEWIVFDYDHITGVGYLSDIRYVAKGQRIQVDVREAVCNFEHMVTKVDEIISNL